jgi:hypothetical protein
VEVSECEDGVVDDGGTVDFGWTKTEGADTGVGRVRGAGEGESTVEDEEGDRGEEVKKVSAAASGEVGRLG